MFGQDWNFPMTSILPRSGGSIAAAFPLSTDRPLYTEYLTKKRVILIPYIIVVVNVDDFTHI